MGSLVQAHPEAQSGCSAVGSAPGLGPGGRTFEPCHPDSFLHRGVEQLAARQAHNLEVARSSRVSATNNTITAVFSGCDGVIVFFSLFTKKILVY